MNRSRYASITSHLLVRKGEAKPWQMPGAEATAEFAHVPENIVPVKAEHHFTDEEKNSASDYENWKRARDAEAATAERRHPHANGHANGHAVGHARRDQQAAPHLESDEHSKRLTLRLTPSEYERLGIIGVKRDMTRQQLLRHAIDCYLAAAKAEYQSACGCLAGDGCRGEC
jgi:hypothetical protein